ncbi:SDR family NAD(P)-dependent oxidoreductase [Streptomyces zhihengii]
MLVTGADGPLGAHAARWAADRGPARLLLVSDNGPDDEAAAELAAELTATGVPVTVHACRVTDPDAVRELLAAIPAEVPLSAVVFTAAVPSSDPVHETDPEGCNRALAGRVLGATALHHALGDTPLDAFVLFSSVAGTWGGAGQGAYAAANACLDALAEFRRCRNLPATCVAWGPWEDGARASHGHDLEHLHRRGCPRWLPGWRAPPWTVPSTTATGASRSPTSPGPRSSRPSPPRGPAACSPTCRTCSPRRSRPAGTTSRTRPAASPP